MMKLKSITKGKEYQDGSKGTKSGTKGITSIAGKAKRTDVDNDLKIQNLNEQEKAKLKTQVSTTSLGNKGKRLYTNDHEERKEKINNNMTTQFTNADNQGRLNTIKSGGDKQTTEEKLKAAADAAEKNKQALKRVKGENQYQSGTKKMKLMKKGSKMC